MKLKFAKSLGSLLLVLFAATALVGQQAAPAPSRTTVRAGRLLDVRIGKTLTNQSIVIEDGKIVSVGPDSGAAGEANVKVIDLSGKTVLPGLIDAHTHLTFDPKFGYDRLAISVPREALIGAKNARVTDAAVYPHGLNAHEFAVMVKLGLTPLQSIQAATVNDADLLGWSDRVGAIEPNHYADIIAVDGDPLQDVTTLERVKFVMKGGVVYKNE